MAASTTGGSPHLRSNSAPAAIAQSKPLRQEIRETAGLSFTVERVTFRMIGLNLLRGDVYYHGRAVMTIDRMIDA